MGMLTIKPLETRCNGYRFRSRLEARWSIFLEELGIEYAYEPQGYVLPSGPYLPDFYLPKYDKFIEIKPADGRERSPARKIYLAGKMTDWRRAIKMCGHAVVGPNSDDKPHNFTAHRRDCNFLGDIIKDCFGAIDECDTIFAWVENLDCYGTLIEIGYGHGIGKKIMCAVHTPLFEKIKESATPSFKGEVHDLWFLDGISERFGFFDTPAEAMNEWLGDLDDDEKKCADLSTIGSGVWLFRGDPVDFQAICFASGNVLRRAAAMSLFIADLGLSGIGRSAIDAAARRARSARFEYGEHG